jgi:orotidine-5'-phosphate decarboxylase
MSQTSLRKKLIVALDVSSDDEALKIVDTIGESADFYKVGLQLFTAAGPKVVRKLIDKGKKVFLDLKLHEIPNSVASATKAAGDLGVSMVTIHASGGAKMMRAAAEAACLYPGLDVLAVTVVTSLTDQDLKEIGLQVCCAEQVLRLAKLAENSGCAGIVSSPQEIHALRGLLNRETLIVTPGVRPSESDTQDQSRTATPFEAMRSGASHLVIGRPITRATDVADMVNRVLDEMASGLACLSEKLV